MTFNLDGNSLRGADGSAINLQKATTGTLLSGRITNNSIGATGVALSASKSAHGVYLAAAGSGTVGLTILNNQIRNWFSSGLYFDNTGGTYTANFTIQGNTIAEPGPSAFSTLSLTNGAPASTDTINVCAAIGGGSAALRNTFTGPTNVADVWLIASGAATGHTFNLPGYAGGSTAAVQSFVGANNTISGGATYVVSTDPPVTASAFTGTGSTCPTP
jgi:hypothetical protein